MISWKRQVRLLSMPLLIAVLILVAVPALMTLGLAFTDYDGLRWPPTWAGLDNFSRLIGDDIFWTALWNSLIFVVIAVPLRLAAALGTSLLYARRGRGVGPERAVTYLPTVVPDISYALLWLWVFNPLYGPLALAADAVGFPVTEWLLGPWSARIAIVVMSVFQIGEGFVVALAARHDIPRELYELSEIDGARPLWTFRRVTLPLMAPALVLLAARDIVFSFQVNFVPALILTDGGPFYATTFLPLWTYRNAFEFFRFGYAAAMTLVMYFVTLVMVGIQLIVVRRRATAWSGW